MAANEALTLDDLELNDGTTYTLEAVDFPPPPRLVEWVRSVDSDGSLLSREPPTDNREITARVRVEPQSTMDLALAQISAITDKLEEAQRNPGGIDLVWTPADSTLSTTFKVLRGEITDMPVTVAGDGAGWFVRAPVVTIKLTCLPFGYGTEVVGTPTSSTDPVVTVELTGVTGDVPALARVIVTDNASKDRRLVRAGLESRHYPTSSPPSLIVDSDSLTPAAGASSTTRTGAYDPGASGSSVIRLTLATQAAEVCSTGNLSHVGNFRAFARVMAYSPDPTASRAFVRLAWRDGDGPFRANAYATPPAMADVDHANNWAEVDLGVITIPERVLGLQRWAGRIEAYATGADLTLDVDYLYLIPCGEGYGEATASYTYEAGSPVARDDFAGRTAGDALTVASAPLGGAWSTSGATTDFTAADGPGATDETITRATTSDSSSRLAIIGSTSWSSIEVGVGYRGSAEVGGSRHHGVIARYVDASNYLRLSHQSTTNDKDVWLEKIISGAPTRLLEIGTAMPINTWLGLRLVVFASGHGIATWLDASGNTLDSREFADSDLASGGPLATGKVGIIDRNGSAIASTRYYRNFYAAAPPAEAIVCYSGQSIEFRHDGTLREDPTGTYWGHPPAARAGVPTIPCAGTRDRKTRIAVVARRNNTRVNPDDQIADSTTVQVNYIPRVLYVPR